MSLIAHRSARSRCAKSAFVALVTIAMQGSAEAALQSPIGGRWVNPAHSVIIKIAPCGSALCGTVIWANAQAKKDASAGRASLVGTKLLTGLHQQGAQWQGQLFVPDRNLHVEARIQRAGRAQLKVSGCAIGGLLCDSQLWTRAKGKLKR